MFHTYWMGEVFMLRIILVLRQVRNELVDIQLVPIS